MKTTTLLQKGLIAAGAATAIGLGMSAPAQAASLIGDNVNIGHFFPDASTPYKIQSTTVTSDNSDLFDYYGIYTADMGSSAVNIDFLWNNTMWNMTSFNGLKISSLDFDDLSNIIDVTFETNWIGFDASRVSWTTDSVSFNFSGLSFNSTNYINATFITDSTTAVPTPAAVLPVLGAMLAAARRRKNVEVEEA